jgi:hypothetical protein
MYVCLLAFMHVYMYVCMQTCWICCVCVSMQAHVTSASTYTHAHALCTYMHTYARAHILRRREMIRGLRERARGIVLEREDMSCMELGNRYLTLRHGARAIAGNVCVLA